MKLRTGLDDSSRDLLLQACGESDCVGLEPGALACDDPRSLVKPRRMTVELDRSGRPKRRPRRVSAERRRL